MDITVNILLTLAGLQTGPFDLYSDLDGYITPFETNVPRETLLSGYISNIVPLFTQVIRCKSMNGDCPNYIDIPISGEPPIPPSPTPTNTPTMTVTPTHTITPTPTKTPGLPSPMNFGTGFNDTVYGIDVANDGRVIVSGKFTTFNGNTRVANAFLNTNGSINSTYLNLTNYTGTCLANQIIQLQDGKFAAAGTFYYQFDSNSANFNFGLYNSDSSIISTYGYFMDPRVPTGNQIVVKSISQLSNGTVLIGGAFNTYSQITTTGTLTSTGSTKNITALNNTDYLYNTGYTTNFYSTTINEGGFLPGTTNKILQLSNGNILVGGDGHFWNGKVQISSKSNALVTLSGTTGTNLFKPNPPTYNFGSFGGVNDILEYDSTTYLVAAFDTFYGPSQVQYQSTVINVLLKIDTTSGGQYDTTFNTNLGTGFNNSVLTIAKQSDGKILAAGNFTSFNGTSYNRMVRLNSNGTFDSSFNIGTGFNGQVNKIKILSSGNIVVGGDFTTYNGVSANRIVALDTFGNINS
jgi:hypothetical protein